MTTISAFDFQKAITDGDLVPKKGGTSYRIKAGAAIGQLLEQECGQNKIMQQKALKSKKPKTPKKEAKQLSEMKLWLYAIYCNDPEIIIEYEYPFAKELKRKFRADIAFPNQKLIIEYDGVNSLKSGHTTLVGLSHDRERDIICQQLGYTVYRYTVLSYQNVISDVETYLKDYLLTLRPNGNIVK